MKREEQIFTEAVAIIAPELREAYLQQECVDDPPLRARIDGLLRHFQEANQISFLDASERAEATLIPQSEPIGPIAGSTIGRYMLGEQIGEGGCGIVYVAEQQEPIRRRVALKIIKPGMDSRSVIARFEAERQALAMMDHPNIAKVLDAGATSSGHPYFVMELVRGVKITEYCDQASLSTAQRLKLFTQVCSAVQHAHQKAVIHRDLKPSNILVTLHDDAPAPKVIDFGIAKAVEGGLTQRTVYTQLHQFVGTPAYMSPEQAERSGLDVDTRSDIYSLGVLLYELLTGKTPFDGQMLLAAGLDAMCRIIREQEPVRPSTRLVTLVANELTTTAHLRRSEPPKLILQVRGDLDWIVMKCLEKDRNRRYQTANALAADISRHLENEPVLARPPSGGYRLQKMICRNRLAFASLAIITMLIVLGLTVSLSQTARAWRAEQIARVAEARETQLRLEADRERERAKAGEANAVAQLYSANLHNMQLDWDQNNLGHLRELLRETAAYPDRGFEWFYWQRQMHLELQTFRGRFGGVTALALSPDGQRIMISSSRPADRVWDAVSGYEVFAFQGPVGDVNGISFSSDCRRVATFGNGPEALVWDAATGRELFRLQGEGGPIKAVVLSADDRGIYTLSSDQTINRWDAITGARLLTLKGEGGQIQCMAVSPNGERIAVGKSDGTVTIWPVKSGGKSLTFQAHRVLVRVVAFSPDDERIVTGSNDQTAQVWRASTGEHLSTLEGHGAFVVSAAFSPDGARIVTGSEDQTARIWESGGGKALLCLKGHSGSVTAVAFAPDGQRVITGSTDETVKVWDSTSDHQSLTLEGALDVLAAAFSHDGLRIVTGGEDGKARVWQASGGKRLVDLAGHTNCVCATAFSPDDQKIVTGSWDGTARVWTSATGVPLFILKGHSGPVESVVFAPDGLRIASGGEDGTVRLWDAASGAPLLTWTAHDNWVGSVAFSPDGQKILSSGDATAKVWDAASGKLLLTLAGHRDKVRSAAFSPDAQRIVTCSYDRTARLWEAATGRLLFSLVGHGGWVVSASFSPDSRRVATGSFDQTARIWQVANGHELLALRPNANVTGVGDFSPDGQHLLTGGGLAKVWQAASHRQVELWEEEMRRGQ